MLWFLLNVRNFWKKDFNKTARKQQSIGTIIQIAWLKTELQDEEMLKTAHEREPQFKAIPVLVQKYYIKLGTPGEYGGVSIRDSKGLMEKFRQSKLAATIAQATVPSKLPRLK